MVMAAQERDLYEVLSLGCDCSQEDIRTAYKKLALQCHPDKLLIHDGITEEAATAQFQELLRAYEVLSNPEQRSSYDHRRSLHLGPRTYASAARSSKPPAPKCSGPDLTAADLRAFSSDSAFCGYSDTEKGFYKVYSDLFEKVFAAEVRYAMKTGQRVRKAPVLGNRDSPDAHVMAFYSYWERFGEVEESTRYDPEEEESWSPRRWREEKEKKERQEARREYYRLVRGLAQFVMDRDRRVIGNIDMVRRRGGLSTTGWRRI